MEYTGALRESGNMGMLHGITITALNTTALAVDIIIFNDSITPSGDNDPVAFNDADMAKIIGTVSFFTGDWVAFDNSATATVQCRLPLEVTNAPGTVYVQMATRTAITPGTTSDYTLSLGISK